jgi:methylenetetrahydrofolate dehydrogenase (NADP+)/methenyltetrahydrofolate cyclohydrolase
MVIVDGRKIADEIYTKIRERVHVLGRTPVLTIFTCAPNFETKKYLALKEKKAKEVGIIIETIELSEARVTVDFIAEIQRVVPRGHSIIVQLPLPVHIDTDAVVRSIPPPLDADALNPETVAIYSPVVGAIRHILGVSAVSPFKKQVTIIGNGTLVGLPAYRWFTEQGAYVSVVTKDTSDIGYYTKSADIVVCGAGVPGLLTSDMVKEGVVILDAGTSEEGGELRGDADFPCAEKAVLFTPVPGGIGPVTVAILLANVVDCAFRTKDVI